MSTSNTFFLLSNYVVLISLLSNSCIQIFYHCAIMKIILIYFNIPYDISDTFSSYYYHKDFSCWLWNQSLSEHMSYSIPSSIHTHIFLTILHHMGTPETWKVVLCFHIYICISIRATGHIEKKVSRNLIFGLRGSCKVHFLTLKMFTFADFRALLILFFMATSHRFFLCRNLNF